MEHVFVSGFRHRRLEQFGDLVFIRRVIGHYVWELIRTERPPLEERFKANIFPEHKDHPVGNKTNRQLVVSLIENKLNHDVLVCDISLQTDVIGIGIISANRNILHGLGR